MITLFLFLFSLIVIGVNKSAQEIRLSFRLFGVICVPYSKCTYTMHNIRLERFSFNERLYNNVSNISSYKKCEAKTKKKIISIKTFRLVIGFQYVVQYRRGNCYQLTYSIEITDFPVEY